MSKDLNCHYIYIGIIFILVCIIIRLSTNDGKILNEFFKYRKVDCEKCEKRYKDCMDTDRRGSEYCKRWAGENCFQCLRKFN